MATKNQAAAEARAKAQAQVKAKERRTTVIIIAVSLLVIMGFAAVVFFIVNSSKVSALPEVHTPATADADGGIPVGKGGVAGVDVPGQARCAWTSTSTPCVRGANKMEQANLADIDAMREDGTIAVYYHPLSILDGSSAGTKYSTRAANAIAVVADKDPSHVLPFITALYANQPEESSPGLTDDEIAALAVGVGVPSDVAATFKNGEFTEWVISATDKASQEGRARTPTIVVNNEILDTSSMVNYLHAGHTQGVPRAGRRLVNPRTEPRVRLAILEPAR